MNRLALRIQNKILNKFSKRIADRNGNMLIHRIDSNGKPNVLAELLALKQERRRSIDICYPQNYITIGDYTYGSPKVRHWPGNSRLTIGKFCSFATGVQILLGGDHAARWLTTFPFYGQMYSMREKRGEYLKNGKQILLGQDVTIGNDVWVGTDATILAGVTIGDGCIIGANALVTKDKALEPYSIWAGIPAVKIGMRFPAETIEKLLKIQWWNWSDEEISGTLDILMSENIEELVEYYEKQKNSL
jgi:acetyltransferase-like isoleucine patch superfamily enzyme